MYNDVNESLFFEAEMLVTSMDYCTKPLLNDSYDLDLYFDFEGQNCSALDEDIVQDYQACRSTDGIIYGKFDFDTTIVTEFDLVCEEQYKVCCWSCSPPAAEYPLARIFQF